MALTNPQRLDVLRQLLIWLPNLANLGYTKPDMFAAIDATDTWITANKGASSTNTGYNTVLVAPWVNATVAQKTMLFCAVAMKQAGLI